MLHLWSPLHSLGTFLAPLVYLPWKTNECYLKAYSLIDFAITLPDGVSVMIDFEVAMGAVWTKQVVQEAVEQHPISGSALFGRQ